MTESVRLTYARWGKEPQQLLLAVHDHGSEARRVSRVIELAERLKSSVPFPFVYVHDPVVAFRETFRIQTVIRFDLPLAEVIRELREKGFDEETAP